MNTNVGGGALWVAACVTVVSHGALAQENPLRIIADTDTPVPGLEELTFQIFGQLEGVDPDISGSNVVFGACCPGGIYGWFGDELRVIADLNSTFPGTGNPLGFDLTTGSSPTISGRNVAFACRDGNPGLGGICASINGQLRMIALSGTTLVPGTDVTFGTFFMLNGSSPSISGQNVAFAAAAVSGSINGIYAMIDGELRTIADNSTPVPGEVGVTFLNFLQLSGNSPSISGENVVFSGEWAAGGGIYAYIDGALRVIADLNTPVPGSAGTFSNPLSIGGWPSIDGENIAFVATFPGGIFAYIDGQLRLVAGDDTPAPESPGTFGAFTGSPVISGQNIVFGAGAEGHGLAIFAYIDGSLELIASNSTTVPGHEDTTFDQFFLQDGFQGEDVRPAISGKNVVFTARAVEPMENDVTGIYGRIIDPPIPTTSTWSLIMLTVMLLTAGVIVLLRRRRMASYQE